MGWADRLRGLLGPLTAGSGLGRVECTSALVPVEAEYVTLGQVRLLPDARAFVGGTPGSQPYRYDFGLTPAQTEPDPYGLLVLAGRRLRVIGPAEELWSTAVEHITDLDGHRHGGFVVLTHGQQGLAVSTQVPVEVPPGARWRTMRGMTNLFGGWDELLAPYGARIHW